MLVSDPVGLDTINVYVSNGIVSIQPMQPRYDVFFSSTYSVQCLLLLLKKILP